MRLSCVKFGELSRSGKLDEWLAWELATRRLRPRKVPSAKLGETAVFAGSGFFVFLPSAYLDKRYPWIMRLSLIFQDTE